MRRNCVVANGLGSKSHSFRDISLLAPRPLFQQGQKLRIIAGPYASLEVIFEMEEGDERATVLLDLLGRQSRVTVDVAQLVPDGAV